MAEQQESFGEALARVEAALSAVVRGDPGQFADLWSRGDDASLFGAFGPARFGWDELSSVLPWVAARYRGGTLEIENLVVWEGPEVAFTVGYERAHVSIDGGESGASVIRVTHIFRREGGRWMLVHRHGDFATIDDAPRRIAGEGPLTS